MSKPLPISKIPKDPGFTEPTISEVTKELPHYLVGSDYFLVKNQATKKSKTLGAPVVNSDGLIKVFEVYEEYFKTFAEAEKKQKLILRKHRDLIREASQVFSIEKASYAEKNADMKWFLENYGPEEITAIYPEYFRPWRLIMEDCPELIRRSAISADWDWMKNRPVESYYKVPLEYNEVQSKRKWWHDKIDELEAKIKLVEVLANRRALEVYVKNSKDNADFDESNSVVSLTPFHWIHDMTDFTPISEEIKDIFALINEKELGEKLEIKMIKGEVVYWSTDNPKEKNPFKKF